jgi:hypothetical protein
MHKNFCSWLHNMGLLFFRLQFQHASKAHHTHIHTQYAYFFSTGHPRESEEWKNMDMEQRYAFFAPIWRVMRDDNMSVEEVGRQIRHVALTVKQGSQVRHLGLEQVGWVN